MFPAADCTGFSDFTSTVSLEHVGAAKGPFENSSVLVVCLSAAMETGNQTIHPDPCQRRTSKTAIRIHDPFSSNTDFIEKKRSFHGGF
ncbi:mCG128449 [Mus musculus]|nr:mCG128449 [Mus musculus]